MHPPGAPSLARGLILGGNLYLAGVVAGAGILLLGGSIRDISTLHLAQDMPVLALAGLVLHALARWPLRLSPTAVALPARPLAVTAALLTVIAAYLGSRTVYHGYALSLDEFMAVFDTKILREGRLFAAVAPEWRAYVPALQPIFRLDMPDHAAWLSSYLPMNAALQALLGLATPPGMGVALLAGLSVVALYGVARRIWPDRPDAAAVAVVLLVSSPQFLATAMTPYAMTAHLAVNLVWLWLFQRDTRVGHALAAGVAFVGCGLHQVAFHPVFAAPFVLSLWFARRYRAAAFHTFAYALIGLFWISYWGLLFKAAGGLPVIAGGGGPGSFVARAAGLISLSPQSFGLMARNLFRFEAWQNPFAVVLLIVAVAGWRSWRGPMLPLALGILGMLGLTLLVMPFQGHGWGYRYLHGFLGSLSLLAAHGWVQSTRTAERARTSTALLVATLVTLAVAMPYHARRIETFVRPFARASRAIAAAQAPIVIVDPTGVWYGVDLVRNDPDLRQGPKVLVLDELDPARLRALCARGEVAVFDRTTAAELGMRLAPMPEPRPNQESRELMRALGCGRMITVPKV